MVLYMLNEVTRSHRYALAAADFRVLSDHESYSDERNADMNS